eukprot:TRINITY_DN33804_c0_g2_i1.p1 TRINITY_DN33804_c0_g2~~TRINITY_DN33804_c0_g2_i1.p1  ORF type:complete len:152 (-),score=26.84 TRINITY_DN33804_c0_g2_i1:17-427(-)
MVDVWLLFNLIVPFVEVLLHTYIDSLRDDEDGGGEEREINHHGKPRKVEPADGEVIQVQSASDKKLVSRNEKVQVDALRNYYMTHSKRKKKLEWADMSAHRIIPGIAISFITIFWTIGLLLYSHPKEFGLIDPYCA